jgi:hypothetical protein
MANKSRPCEWTTQEQALQAFAGFTEKTQSAGHIRPLHWYVACRLVVEGGVDPDHIKPRPPFVVRKKRGGLNVLEFDPATAGGGEAVVLGGLKTKNVDVVVTRPEVGPVLAVSCKGTTGAFRNLTNRMEELIGDCTNLHISYPALVLGYLHVMRANRRLGEMIELIQGEDQPTSNSNSEEEGDFESELETQPTDLIEEDSSDEAEQDGLPTDAGSGEVKLKRLTKNDLAFGDDGAVSPEIGRFSLAVSRLAGRSGIRDELTRYESIGLALVEAGPSNGGELVSDFPPPASDLDLCGFFGRLYAQYDERFVYGAPSLMKSTRRFEWHPDSPAWTAIKPDYLPRLGVPKAAKPRRTIA